MQRPWECGGSRAAHHPSLRIFSIGRADQGSFRLEHDQQAALPLGGGRRGGSLEYADHHERQGRRLACPIKAHRLDNRLTPSRRGITISESAINQAPIRNRTKAKGRDVHDTDIALYQKHDTCDRRETAHTAAAGREPATERATRDVERVSQDITSPRLVSKTISK